MTSKVAQFPIASSSKPSAKSHIQSHNRVGGVAPLNPLTFVPPFDVLTELADNKDQYSGDEQQTIYNFPDYLRTALDRVRARVVTTSKPGLSPTITCCMSYGLEALSACEDVKTLLALRDRCDLTDNPDSWLVEEVAAIFRFFPLTLPDYSLSLSHKQNVALTESVKKDTAKISSDLGTSFSAIAILSVMITLVDQPCVMKERRENIQRIIDGFLRRAKIRRGVMEALLDTVLEIKQ